MNRPRKNRPPEVAARYAECSVGEVITRFIHAADLAAAPKLNRCAPTTLQSACRTQYCASALSCSADDRSRSQGREPAQL